MSNLQIQDNAPKGRLDVRPHENEITLIEVDAGDFLPELGGWSQKFGRNILITTTACLIGLAVWPWRETVRAAGVIRPYGENTLVQSQLDGSLSTVWVHENQEVRKGQPLAVLDRRQLENEKSKLESELRESRAQQQSHVRQDADLAREDRATSDLVNAQLVSASRDLDNARATLRFRETEVRRYQKLLGIGAVSASVVDEKSAQLSVASNEVAKSLQAVKEQRARGAAQLASLSQRRSQTENQGRDTNKLLETVRSRLTEINRALNNSTIKSPTTGTVLMSGLRHPQQVIRAGEILAQIAPRDARQLVNVSVPSSEISAIREKQDAYLRVAGCPYPEYGVLKAKVRNIAADSLQAESTKSETYTLGSEALFQISLEPAARELRDGKRVCYIRHGMNVQAEIVTRRTTVLGLLLTKLRLATGA